MPKSKMSQPIEPSSANDITLKAAFDNRNIEAFKTLLNTANVDVNECKKIFFAAVWDEDCNEFVREIIKRRFIEDSALSLYPRLNLIAVSQNLEMLEDLLSEMPEWMDQHKLITKLLQMINSETFDNVYRGMDLLITQYGENFNLSNENEISLMPILKKKDLTHDQKEELIKLFLKSKHLVLYVDEEARERIIKEFPDIQFYWLQYYLKSKNESQFGKEYPAHMSTLLSQPNVLEKRKTILLIDALRYGLVGSVKIIVHSGLNIDRQLFNGLFTTEVENELMLTTAKNPLLYLISCDEFIPGSDQFADYELLFSLICEKAQKLINVTDEAGKTPLYHAVLNKNERTALKLLQYGAYVGALAEDGGFPMRYMSVAFWEEFLDSLVTLDKESVGFETFFDFKNFFNGDVENVMPFIERIGKSREFRHLLKHPLIKFYLKGKFNQMSYLLWPEAFFIISLWMTSSISIFSPKLFMGVFGFVLQQFLIATTLLMITKKLFTWKSSFRHFIHMQNSVEILSFSFAIYLMCSFEPTIDIKIHRYIVLFGTLLLAFYYGSFALIPFDNNLLVNFMFQLVIWRFVKNVSVLWRLISILVISFAIISALNSQKTTNESRNFINLEFSNPIYKQILVLFCPLCAWMLSKRLTNKVMDNMQALESEAEIKVQMKKLNFIAEWTVLSKKIGWPQLKSPLNGKVIADNTQKLDAWKKNQQKKK